MQGLQRVGVDGQTVQQVGESGGGGLVTTEDEDEGLGQNLMLSQTCKKRSKGELSQAVQKTDSLNETTRQYGFYSLLI